MEVKDIILKNVKSAMVKEKFKKMKVSRIIFILFTLMLQSISYGQNNFNNFDQIHLKSGVYINCLLLIEGKDPKYLETISFLDKNLKIQKISKSKIQEIKDLSNNTLFKAEGSLEQKTNETISINTSGSKEEIKSEKISCAACNAKGSINKKCINTECSEGFIATTCTTCKGNYRSGKGLCKNPGCNYEGCEYCDYDAAACTKCTRGKTTIKHELCNGTGKTSIQCLVCKGKGYTFK